MESDVPSGGKEWDLKASFGTHPMPHFVIIYLLIISELHWSIGLTVLRSVHILVRGGGMLPHPNKLPEVCSEEF